MFQFVKQLAHQLHTLLTHFSGPRNIPQRPKLLSLCILNNAGIGEPYLKVAISFRRKHYPIKMCFEISYHERKCPVILPAVFPTSVKACKKTSPHVYGSRRLVLQSLSFAAVKTVSFLKSNNPTTDGKPAAAGQTWPMKKKFSKNPEKVKTVVEYSIDLCMPYLESYARFSHHLYDIFLRMHDFQYIFPVFIKLLNRKK